MTAITYKKQAFQYRLVKEPAANVMPIASQKITDSRTLCDYLRQIYKQDGDNIGIYESFYALALNNANNVIGWQLISRGGISGTVTDISMILKFSIEMLAKAVVICHNHPSGSLKPSNSDNTITKKVKSSLEIMDLKLLDHLILTEDNYFSFTDDGLI